MDQESAQDPFEVEISDLPPDEESEPGGATRLSLQARLSPQARAKRIGLVGSVLLALLVVTLGNDPRLRTAIVGTFTGLLPVPTATLAPGADRFYFATDVPWTTVALDGQIIHLPRIGLDSPLHLERGHHWLIWTAEPFQPQRCRIDVPPTSPPSCPISDQVRQGSSGPLVSVIDLHESLDTLPTAQQQALLQAVQMGLSGYSEIMHPGESYLIASGGSVVGNRISKQSLRATLQLQLDTASMPDACFLNPRSGESLRCTIAWQGCPRFCTVPWQARQADTTIAGRLEWKTLAVIFFPSWNYTTEAGVSTLQNQPDCICEPTNSRTLVLLDITWDGLAWQVQPLFGPNQGSPLVVDGIPVADDPACLVAEDFFPEEFQTYAQLRFISGPNPAAGCLLEATLVTPQGTPTTATPVEEYLARFGELVAVNDLAHQRNPQWPVADAYEQQLAHQLAALPGGLGFP